MLELQQVAARRDLLLQRCPSDGTTVQKHRRPGGLGFDDERTERELLVCPVADADKRHHDERYAPVHGQRAEVSATVIGRACGSGTDETPTTDNERDLTTQFQKRHINRAFVQPAA